LRLSFTNFDENFNTSIMEKAKFLKLVILGMVFWFAAAMVVRFSNENVFSENNPLLFFYFFMAFPSSYCLILISKKTAKLQSSEILNAVVIMTFIATFLDGIALSWFGQLYGETYEIRLFGSAWILWGVGAGLLLGYITNNNNKIGVII
jgi:hypothetical protein